MAEVSSHTRGTGGSVGQDVASDGLDDAVQSLLDLPQCPDSLTLHGILHGLCSDARRDLDSLLRDESWVELCADIESVLFERVDSGAGVGEAVTEALGDARGPRDCLLVTCAGLLRGLDRLHLDRCTVIQHQIRTLPGCFGGDRFQWFGPPNHGRFLAHGMTGPRCSVRWRTTMFLGGGRGAKRLCYDAQTWTSSSSWRRLGCIAACVVWSL